MVMSRWRKARNALGLHVCVSPTSDESLKQSMTGDGELSSVPLYTSSASALISPRYSSKLRSSAYGSSVRISTCAICLESMKTGHGQALFTAECSHSFHFACIASNVRYGSLGCPVCRATWKEVPWQAPPFKQTGKKNSGSAVSLRQIQSRSASLSPRLRPPSPAPLPPLPHSDADMEQAAAEEQCRLEPVLRMLDESIANFRSESMREKQAMEVEPAMFDDDEPLDVADCCEQRAVPLQAASPTRIQAGQAMQITALPEETEIPSTEERGSLTVLVHVKGAAARDEEQQLANMLGSPATVSNGCAQRRRAAVDLVAVLDISGSMAGTKLTLMKRAMRLVVRSLGPADRLSIVAFASSARRVLALRRMTEEGRRAAMEALDSLSCTGGTSIADGLRKGSAVLQQRRQNNPVATIMLLSDGQDSFTMRQPPASRLSPPLPPPRDPSRQPHYQIPVHTFGLGIDHDAGAMHSISEESGGTFSFLQGEGLMQDAFAQCLGGLLSVVALRVEVEVEIVNQASASLLNMETGSYSCEMVSAGGHGRVYLGDLYAHEERDLLVNIKLPSLPGPAAEVMVMTVHARYFDPLSGTSCRTATIPVMLQRPTQSSGVPRSPCVEVDRHRNRLCAAHAIVESRALADRGELPAAQRLLEGARQKVQCSVAMRTGDKLSAALDAEMARIQRSMGNASAYERCGRAYALSAQSSHMRQRATMRGETAEAGSEGYRTPSMNSMLGQSSSAPPPAPPERPLIRRHILPPRPGSRLSRLASFDSVIRE
ncbi:hypothetical protein KP509_24G014600 [Ceratopteris richardii]|uniref:Uncharacterized protein n=1 Tax=Ceratopteris richardii TaxID=49495 RepID=A0A8T2RTF5_CERRI|nr:hypothetical protein KP509_24G014600 [Ceratopteris richardii]